MARKVVLAGACRTAIGVMGRTVCKYIGCRTWNDRNQRSSQKSGRFLRIRLTKCIWKCYPAGNGQNPARQALYMRNPE